MTHTRIRGRYVLLAIAAGALIAAWLAGGEEAAILLTLTLLGGVCIGMVVRNMLGGRR